MESKKDIRKRVLKNRSALTKKEWEERSRKIYEQVVTHPFFLQADAIYCYVDYKNEACTADILAHAWKIGKKVAVPKVEGADIHFYYVDSVSDLHEGYKGIFEPDADRPANDKNVLLIMPGAAFDYDCNRIGYGKGYYDRYLKEHPNFRSIAIGFELQMVERIPADCHDRCPGMIITEGNIYESEFRTGKSH